MRLPALPVFLGLELAASLAFMVTFAMTNVYYVTEVGMSPLQLVLCGTAMESPSSPVRCRRESSRTWSAAGSR